MENLLKTQISDITSVISTFNKTVHKPQINDKLFNSDIKKIGRYVHQLNGKLANVEAKLNILEICEKLMENNMFLDDILKKE